jgi:putative tricarboxylic transport membrane protein
MGVFVGGITAGSLTAIAIGIPGTPASAATVLDGHPLTLAGRAGEAISTMFLLDLVGGLLGAVVCILVAPELASFALRFGPPEYALLAFIGMSLVVSLSSRSLLKGLISGLLGMAAATIGVDPMTGVARFAMGNPNLEAGIGYGAVMIGLFGLTEVLIGLGQPARDLREAGERRFVWLPHVRTALRNIVALRWTILRSAPIGIFIGALPGLGSDIAAWLGYDAAKRFAKRPQDFGNGSLEGLAGCEVAKSSEDGGAIIPTVTFGIPGDSQTVVILGALMLHGLRPGPLLFTEHADIVWSVFAALIVAPLVTCALGLMTVRPTVWLVSRPSHLLYPAVILFCIVGAFAYSNSVFDVWMMVLFGALGVGMRLLDYPVVPFVLTYILTPLMEAEFRRGLALVQDNALAFFERPLFVALLVVGVLAFLGASNVFSRAQSRVVEQE